MSSLNKQIGVSLPFNMLVNADQMDPSAQALLAAYNNDLGGMLEALRNLGVNSIELRGVKGTEPEPIAKAARLCADAGMQVTIHGNLPISTNPSDFFHQYTGLPINNRCIIVQHALKTDIDSTVLALQGLAAYADENLPHLFIALENERHKPTGGSCQSCEDVARALTMVNHPRINACWDFGHHHYNVLTSAEEESMPESMLPYIVHTHIHGVTNGRTHFPLDGNNPLP